MIPYYSWCHRGANEMAVWLPRSIEKAKLPPKPTIATTAGASASSGIDFTPVTGDYTIPSGMSAQSTTVAVPIVDDDLVVKGLALVTYVF